MGATSNYDRSFIAKEKKVEEEVGPGSLEVDVVGYSVEYLEGKESPDFLGQG